MTDVHALLCEAGEALYGSRWVTEMARDLPEPRLNLQRYKDRTRAVPAALLPRVRALMERREAEMAAVRCKLPP